MTAPIGQSPSIAGPSQANSDQRLRKAAQQLEGIFVSRMFAAMRETVPDDGIVQESNAQSMFSDMLDQHVAEGVPNQLGGTHSLADALYQQLRQREHPTAPSAAPAKSGGLDP
jgi:peptidoglycan hydrolase FlgJ